MSTKLHIVRLVLDRRELYRIAARHRLPRNVDEGYLLHAGLAQLFASSSHPAKVPFHTFTVDDTYAPARDRQEWVFLLAYADLDEGALLERMGPVRQGLVRQCAAKPVEGFPAGARVGFRARVCPTVRTRHPGDHGPRTDKKGKPKSREVDAWLAHRFSSWQPEPPCDESFVLERRTKEWAEREQVYGEWLKRELQRRGAADLNEGTRLTRFRLEVVHRRGESRYPRASAPRRPNAVLEGTLTVRDEETFRALLRRGLGRHRAFGFGMLLLRRIG